MSSMQEFFHMGGYAFFVWVSYGLAFLILIVNFVGPIMRRRAILRELARRNRRQSRVAQPSAITKEADIHES